MTWSMACCYSSRFSGLRPEPRISRWKRRSPGGPYQKLCQHGTELYNDADAADSRRRRQWAELAGEAIKRCGEMMTSLRRLMLKQRHRSCPGRTANLWELASYSLSGQS